MRFNLRQFLAAVTLVCLGVGAGYALLAAQTRARSLSECESNFRQIALALHNYRSAVGSAPLVGAVDGLGRPLYAWRVTIKSYLYKPPPSEPGYDVAQAWNAPQNAAMLTYGPFRNWWLCPAYRLGRPIACTSYLAVRHNQADRRVKEGITPVGRDGLHTCIVEWHATTHPWTKPEDPDSLPTFEELVATGANGESHAGGFHVLWENGDVEFVRHDEPAD